MASGFVHKFASAYPKNADQQQWGEFADRPLISELIAEAVTAISDVEQFRQLPVRTQEVLVRMAGFMISRANGYEMHDWRKNEWGLYVVGSRARDDARPDSDLDLLSVGTFYRDLDFSDRFDYEEAGVFAGFNLERPDELPDAYNVGEVDRKYLVRATPKAEGLLSIDLSVVDLTFTEDSLEGFKSELDVDEYGLPLARVPLLELTTPVRIIHWRP
jgi:predicted nucleotidyltransferase